MNKINSISRTNNYIKSNISNSTFKNHLFSPSLITIIKNTKSNIHYFYKYCLFCNCEEYDDDLFKIPCICNDCLQKYKLSEENPNKILKYLIPHFYNRINELQNNFFIPIYDLLESREFGKNQCLKCDAPTYYSNTFFCWYCYKYSNSTELATIFLNYIIEVFKNSFNNLENKNIQETIIQQKETHKCLLCKNESEHLICNNCQILYKNKNIYLKITDYENIEILDNKYKGNYVCDDGHIVKSLGEKTIDDYLWKNKIFHVYEPKISINMEKDITPDFLLPNYNNSGKDIYIEHFGIHNNKKYDQQTEYKLNIYIEQNITLICTYEEDLKNINNSLTKKLKFFHENKINFYKESKDISNFQQNNKSTNSNLKYFKVGCLISHKNFGNGIVVNVNEGLIDVIFNDSKIGKKTLIANHPFITLIK